MKHKPFFTAVVVMALTLGIAAPTQAQLTKDVKDDKERIEQQSFKGGPEGGQTPDKRRLASCTRSIAYGEAA